MPDGPFRETLDCGTWVIKRDHPVVPDRQGEIVHRVDRPLDPGRQYIELDEAVDLLNDAFHLGRAAADPQRFFHESLLTGDLNSVS